MSQPEIESFRVENGRPRWIPAPKPPEPLVVPTALFCLTCLTTLLGGFLFHLEFTSANPEEFMRGVRGVLNSPLQLLNGLPFCFTILIILLGHEMGHYLACKYYRIRATLPYVIPAPPPFNPFGTFGAVIRIKSPFRTRKELFDVGVAGPLAGFAFIIPALIYGVSNSREFVLDQTPGVFWQFGEPLLFQWAAALLFDGNGVISLHPVGWAAWFGMLATSLNLLPLGQLDGGHMVYALAGDRGHRIASAMTFASLVALSIYAWPMLGYMLFALILVFLGFRHPAPMDDRTGLGPVRIALAVLAWIIFAATFIPIPVQIVEHVGRL
ncbi:MAG TPA: site-2 protease family protein [Acidobacteriota bacterium]|nr:site-2 protease family protein [Acidobacteriota bacterium]